MKIKLVKSQTVGEFYTICLHESELTFGGDIFKFQPHFVFHSGSDIITWPTFTRDFSALVKSFQLR